MDAARALKTAIFPFGFKGPQAGSPRPAPTSLRGQRIFSQHSSSGGASPLPTVLVLLAVFAVLLAFFYAAVRSRKGVVDAVREAAEHDRRRYGRGGVELDAYEVGTPKIGGRRGQPAVEVEGEGEGEGEETVGQRLSARKRMRRLKTEEERENASESWVVKEGGVYDGEGGSGSASREGVKPQFRQFKLPDRRPTVVPERYAPTTKRD